MLTMQVMACMGIIIGLFLLLGINPVSYTHLDVYKRQEYALVYEGEVDTFSLEDVWEKFGRRVPKDFEGHALSISDVVEFSDEMASRYFYVEPKGFAEIVFKSE